jgi:hypothetical protein
MSEDFIEPSEEIQRLAQEISLLRREAQNINSALGRIEKRLRAAFHYYPKPKASAKGQPKTEDQKLSKTRDELMTLFEKLIEATKQNGDVGFSSEIGKITEEDLVALAYELGVTDGKRISQKKAREAIRKRVQESLLLSYQRRQTT